MDWGKSVWCMGNMAAAANRKDSGCLRQVIEEAGDGKGRGAWVLWKARNGRVGRGAVIGAWS